MTNTVRKTPLRVIEIKTISLFLGNPCSNEVPHFQKRFVKQTQQSLCINNPKLKGSETKKIEY